MRVPKSVLVALVTALVVMAAMTYFTRTGRSPAAAQAGVDRVFLSAAGAPIPTVDTYPDRWRNRDKDTVFDSWGEYNRECTSYVAWMLSSVNGYDMVWHGNATRWGDLARSHGTPVDSTPAVGSVAWRSSGHVAYVVNVEPGRVYVQDYNKHYDGRWDQRWEPTSAWTGFIHFKDLTATPAPPVQAAPQNGGLQVQPANPNSAAQGNAGSGLQGSSGSGLQGSSPNLQGSTTPVQGNGASLPTTSTSAGSSGSSAGGKTRAIRTNPVATTRATTRTTTSAASKPSTTAPPAPSATTPPPPPPPAPRTYTEQSGSHGSPTFTNPYNASGPGQTVPAMSTVQVLCRVYAPQIASANPDGWWYRIASSPWNGSYYAVANTFWNGDTPGVRPYTHNTDWNVPVC